MTNKEAQVFLDNLRICVKEHPIVADWLVEIADRKTESNSEKPNNCEPKICDTCRYYNSNIPCGSTPSACKEADKFAEEFVDGLKKLKQTSPTISKMEQVDKPQTCDTCKYGEDKHKYAHICNECGVGINNYEPKDEPQTDCSWK